MKRGELRRDGTASGEALRDGTARKEDRRVGMARGEARLSHVTARGGMFESFRGFGNCARTVRKFFRFPKVFSKVSTGFEVFKVFESEKGLTRVSV